MEQSSSSILVHSEAAQRLARELGVELPERPLAEVLQEVVPTAGRVSERGTRALQEQRGERG